MKSINILVIALAVLSSSARLGRAEDVRCPDGELISQDRNYYIRDGNTCSFRFAVPKGKFAILILRGHKPGTPPTVVINGRGIPAVHQNNGTISIGGSGYDGDVKLQITSNGSLQGERKAFRSLQLEMQAINEIDHGCPAGSVDADTGASVRCYPAADVAAGPSLFEYSITPRGDRKLTDSKNVRRGYCIKK